MSKILENLLYSDSHEWVKVEGSAAYIGITDYAQHNLGEIVFVELPEVDDEVSKEEDFGAIESVKAASDLIAPFSGVVLEVNEALEDSPELLNEDPYENWIIKVEVSDKSELKDLMSSEKYSEIL